ncbi:Uncharacterised protein [Streptococcus macacae NCTC 11558]|nr:Uncharacterised protein [Streptococcus macacae NCTC 11558]
MTIKINVNYKKNFKKGKPFLNYGQPVINNQWQK